MGIHHGMTSNGRISGWYFWLPAGILLVLGLAPAWELSILLYWAISSIMYGHYSYPSLMMLTTYTA